MLVSKRLLRYISSADWFVILFQEVQGMKLRIANGEDLNSTEFSVWAALAQQMVDAVMTDSRKLL